MKKVISVVVPAYNEEVVIREFLDEKLKPALEVLDYDFEIVIVDDGSKDNTLKMVEKAKICKSYDVRVVSLVRNFGKEAALSAGLSVAKGDAAIMIDADGQHPVSALSEMVTKWKKGAKVVTAVRRHNTTKHKVASKVYYGLMWMMGNKKMVIGALDYRLVDRKVVDEFNCLTERTRMVRGLIDWLGYPQEYVKVDTLNRLNGKPTYSSRRLMRLAVDSLASSSRTPLIVFGYVGIIITFVSLLFGLFILIQQYIMGDPLGLEWSGAVAMSVFVSFLVGLVLISQSMTALYISQIHVEAKARPLFVIDEEKTRGLNERVADKNDKRKLKKNRKKKAAEGNGGKGDQKRKAAERKKGVGI